MNEDLSDWMCDYREFIYDLRINQLILPGTHDSAATEIDFSSKPILDDPLLKIPLIKPTKKFIKNWTITQEFSVKKQLELGIRYLDLRVCYNFDDNTFYCLHTFYIRPLREVLFEISQFIEKHAGEIVLISFSNYFYKQFLTENEIKIYENGMNEMIELKFNKRLAAYDTTTVVGDMINSGKRIMIIPEQNIGGDWINTDNKYEKMNALQYQCVMYTPNINNLYNISWTLTPSVKTIIKSIFISNNIGKLSSKFNKKFKDLFTYITPECEDKINLFTFDFWNEELAQDVIKLFVKILRKRSRVN